MDKKKQKAGYVDGFVFVVPKKNLAKYKKMARDARKVWIKFGAVDYMECMGEDLETKGSGGMPAPLSFIKLTKPKPDETVWFSFVTYKNKAQRNKINKEVMDFFSKKYAKKMDEPMPFDMKKMAYGGFSVQVG